MWKVTPFLVFKCPVYELGRRNQEKPLLEIEWISQFFSFFSKNTKDINIRRPLRVLAHGIGFRIPSPFLGNVKYDFTGLFLRPGLKISG